MGKYRTVPGHEGPYFATWTVVAWQPVFTRRDYFDVIVHSFEYCRGHKGLALYAFVIMPTHVHLIASAAEGGSFSALMGSMKRHTSREIHRLLEQDRRGDMLTICRDHAPMDQDFALWQAEYHPEAVVGQPMAIQKLRYVHENPVRAGFVDDPEHWLYSSARNYADHTDAVTEIDHLF